VLNARLGRERDDRLAKDSRPRISWGERDGWKMNTALVSMLSPRSKKLCSTIARLVGQFTARCIPMKPNGSCSHEGFNHYSASRSRTIMTQNYTFSMWIGLSKRIARHSTMLQPRNWGEISISGGKQTRPVRRTGALSRTRKTRCKDWNTPSTSISSK
jgi:hypothetical protein